MNQVPVKLGPLALLLTVISICLTTFAILTFTTSRADMTLARKYAETVQSRCELEVQGQEYLKDAAAGNASYGERDFEKNGFHLYVTTLEDGSVVRWQHEKEWTEDTSMGNLWNGK